MAAEAAPDPDRPPQRDAVVVPLWRQGYDVVEREIAPRLESLVRSEQMAVAVGLVAKLQRQAQRQAARQTRRMLHLFNLPAGTDVSRILTEIGQLKQQVRDLTRQLDEAKGGAGGAPSPDPD